MLSNIVVAGYYDGPHKKNSASDSG